MSRLDELVRHGKESTVVMFRGEPYGRDGQRELLRDVLAMANADVGGPRAIILGVELGQFGEREFHNVPKEDFSRSPSYQDVVMEFIEPPIRLRYQPMAIDGARLGVLQIEECNNRPYMMRVDHSATLRRGDAWIRSGAQVVKLGRSQLEAIFEKKFSESGFSGVIELGFAGEFIQKEIRVPVVDISDMPSESEAAKIRELLEVKGDAANAAVGTMITRLTHARLFGADSPYSDRSHEELQQELLAVRDRYRKDDQAYLFDTHGSLLDMVVYNQGSDSVQDASLTLAMPNAGGLYVADKPVWAPPGPKRSGVKQKVPPYPSVEIRKDAVLISEHIGVIPAGTVMSVFPQPPRICVGTRLAGRKMAIRYVLYGSNLRRPIRGRLKLLFNRAP